MKFGENGNGKRVNLLPLDPACLNKNFICLFRNDGQKHDGYRFSLFVGRWV